MKNDYDVIVIGGGITGLVAAYKLVKKGKSVALFEETDTLGGVIRPFAVNGYSLEGFYHHLFKRDTLIFELVKELGIEITWHLTKIGFYYSPYEMYSFSSPFDIIHFRKLSPKERIILCRFLAGVYLSRTVKYLSNYSAKTWLISCVGERVYSIFFEPMLRAKFGMYADEIGADWILSRLKLRSVRTWEGEKLGYIRGGFGHLIERLAEEIENMEGKIYVNSKVSSIITESGRAEGVVIEDGRKFHSNHILSTVPPESLLKLVDFPKEYCEKIKELEYQWTICVVIALTEPITNYYWINIMDKKLKFNVLIEHTNFQSRANYNAHIIYLASYPDKNSKIWNMNEGEIIKEYIQSLKEGFPSFSEKKMKWARIFQSNAAGLVYRVGIRRKLPDIQTPIAGLLIGGMFNAYPDRVTNMCARIACECINRIIMESKYTGRYN